MKRTHSFDYQKGTFLCLNTYKGGGGHFMIKNIPWCPFTE